LVEVDGVVDVDQEKTDSLGKDVEFGKALIIVADEAGGERVKGEGRRQDEPRE